MTNKAPYTYSVLKYVHDVASGEFVNLGVVLYSPTHDFFRSSMRRTISRIVRFFPDAKARALTRTIRALETSINRRGVSIKNERAQDMFFEELKDVLDLASKQLPVDDSSLQWSSVSGGLTSDPEKTLDHLFDRLVSRYDEKNKKEARTDDQVWRNFSKALEARNLTSDLRQHEIQAPVDSVCFDHALKNGKWHVLEPVSFDLLDGMSIKRKARQILGEMTILEKSTDDFDVYFLVGTPSHPDVRKEYEVAMSTLSMIPRAINAHIYTEQQADEFALRMVSVMANHN